MRVVWTEQALRRLSEIEDYISRDDPDAALHFFG
jgi:plasmid stabilization system protein ParE